MKIGDQIFYKFYIAEIKLKIDKSKKNLSTFSKLIKSSEKLLSSYKEYIERETTSNFEELLNNPTLDINGSLRERLVIDLDIYTKQAFLIYLKTHFNNIKRYNKEKENLKSLKEQLISYSTYLLITKKFNLKISKEIVKRQYVFKLGYNLGSLIIRRVKRNRAPVNWNVSNKNKQALLDKGLIPYYKKEAEQAEKQGKEYEGIKWQVLHPKTDVFINYINDSIMLFDIIGSKMTASLYSIFLDYKRTNKFNPNVYPLKD